MICIKNKIELPDCPYCGAKLGYLESFVVKNKSIYKCKSCDNSSSVDLKDVFYNILWFVQILCVVIFVFATLIGGGFTLFGLALILIVFSGFYGISPYMVVLKKSKKIVEEKKKKKIFKKKDKSKKIDKEKVVDVQTDKEGISDRDIFSN